MKKLFLLFLTISAIVIACKTVPITGRSQFNVVPDSQILPMSFAQYEGFLKENKISTNASQTKQIKDVGSRISKAVDRYMRTNGMTAEADAYRWEFNLVQDTTINAWCMPGGKIVVYSGILPVTKDDAGLATVMGHEVSHALANHGAQRMSASQLQQLGAVGVAVATGSKSAEQQQMWQQYYGLGSEVGVMLPFSRNHESEADKIGLTLMAIAGYNPELAISFWERMSASSSGNKPPEFLSTHPADATRIANLRKLIPEAKAEALKFGVMFK